MKWKIVAKKVAEGAVEGALAAFGVGLVIGQAGWIPALATGAVVGGLRGGLNAFKHRKDGQKDKK